MSKSYRDYPSCVQDFRKPTYHPVITKSQYLRDTEAWVRQQRREQLLRRVLYLAALAALVAVLLGWPCTDAMCAPAG